MQNRRMAQNSTLSKILISLIALIRLAPRYVLMTLWVVGVVYSRIADLLLRKVELFSTLLYSLTALMLSLKRFIAPVVLSLMSNRK